MNNLLRSNRFHQACGNFATLCLLAGLGLVGTLGLPQAIKAQESNKDSQKQSDRKRDQVGRDSGNSQQARDRKNSGAENKDSKRDAAANSNRVNSDRAPGNRALTTAQENKAMGFVKKHHPELSELLIYLKENEARQYRLAMQGLVRTQERLSLMQQRDESRYRLEIDFWKAESRAKLIAAKIRMKDRPALRKELDGLLAEQLELRQQILTLEKERLADRLQKVDAQIERLDEHADEEIQRLSNALLREKQRNRPSGAGTNDRPNRPATKDGTPASNRGRSKDKQNQTQASDKDQSN